MQVVVQVGVLHSIACVGCCQIPGLGKSRIQVLLAVVFGMLTVETPLVTVVAKMGGEDVALSTLMVT